MALLLLFPSTALGISGKQLQHCSKVIADAYILSHVFTSEFCVCKHN